MYYLKKIITTFFIVIFVSGCSYLGEKSIIANRDTDYLKAKNIPPLKIPPGLSSSTIQAHYPVSEKEDNKNTIKPNLTPPELN